MEASLLLLALVVPRRLTSAGLAGPPQPVPLGMSIVEALAVLAPVPTAAAAARVECTVMAALVVLVLVPAAAAVQAVRPALVWLVAWAHRLLVRMGAITVPV